MTALNGVSFQYNGKGERVEKSLAGTSTRYVYNQQGQLLAETDSNNTTLREYVWLGHWPIAVITPQPAQPSRIDYIHPDHLGTPRLVTNASQTIIWRWDSSPFGATDAQQDPDGDNQAFVLNLRFPGQYFDDETGLHYNYFRDYDPTLGRYIESDPIGLRGGINAYAYVGGNPVMRTDSTGEIWHVLVPAILSGGGLLIYFDCLEKCQKQKTGKDENGESCPTENRTGECVRKCNPFIELMTAPTSAQDVVSEAAKAVGSEAGKRWDN